MRGAGTLLNIATVACGGLLGVYVGDRLPANMRRTIMQGLGLVVLAVAITGLRPLADAGLGLRRFIIMIVAVIVGGIAGEAMRLSDRLDALGERLRDRFHVREDLEGGAERSGFVEGFVVASTVFCVGPLTVLGSVEDGLGIGVRLLAIKSALDGVASVGFASIYGWGVVASLVTIAIYQGALTLGAALIEPVMTPEVLAELGAIGSLLVAGIGLRLLDIAEIRVLNLLPAIVIGPALAGAVAALV